MPELNTPLTSDQIDFRIQSINKGGYATILAYKDARVDMERLDAVYGAGCWQRKHEVINGNLFCSVGVWNKGLEQWVWVQDVGTESNADKEKGQASDAFKRACFNLGIGRELYGYPVIQVKLKQEEWDGTNGKPKQTWNLKLKEWRWRVYFDGIKVGFIEAKDESGAVRFMHYSLDGLENAYTGIKRYIECGDLDGAGEIWYELNEGEMAAMWVAESKGGPFSAIERKVIQSKEFRLAYYGDENE